MLKKDMLHECVPRLNKHLTYEKNGQNVDIRHEVKEEKGIKPINLTNAPFFGQKQQNDPTLHNSGKSGGRSKFHISPKIQKKQWPPWLIKLLRPITLRLKRYKNVK